MAKVLSNGLLKGRVGNLIYYVRNGVQYVRIGTAPNDPKTDKQMRHRAKMRDSGKFFKQFDKVIKIGYQSYGTPLRIFNQVVKYHLANAIEETTPAGKGEYAFRVIPEKVVLAEGKIHAPEIDSCQRTGQDLDLAWNPRIGPVPNRHTDSIALIAYSEGKAVHAEFHAGLRRQGTSKVILPNQYTNPVHLWAFYWNGEKTKANEESVSGSVYLGRF
jgi:hypothetical protein